jgi:hypothetical protein
LRAATQTLYFDPGLRCAVNRVEGCVVTLVLVTCRRWAVTPVSLVTYALAPATGRHRTRTALWADLVRSPVGLTGFGVLVPVPLRGTEWVESMVSKTKVALAGPAVVGRKPTRTTQEPWGATAPTQLPTSNGKLALPLPATVTEETGRGPVPGLVTVNSCQSDVWPRATGP